MIEESKWKWFGNAGHFICGSNCRFHLTTQIGNHLVSTVGQLVFDEGTREITAQCRGITLEGKGDARLADYMNKIGYEEIGYNRTYETMVFELNGKVCESKECQCGLPEIIPSELDTMGYNDGGAATKGHMAMCHKWAKQLDKP